MAPKGVSLSVLHQMAEAFKVPYHEFVQEWVRLSEPERAQLRHLFLYEKQLA